mmetsp:Transcript_58893/g.135893  ORF Transcript_58893/g.135893 Transcript_58893/m.135893 type:complete len:236 (+) Transcript_58893:1528-2235(+)
MNLGSLWTYRWGSMVGTTTRFTSASRHPPDGGVENRSFTRLITVYGCWRSSTRARRSFSMAVSEPSSPQQMALRAASRMLAVLSPAAARRTCVLISCSWGPIARVSVHPAVLHFRPQGQSSHARWAACCLAHSRVQAFRWSARKSAFSRMRHRDFVGGHRTLAPTVPPTVRHSRCSWSLTYAASASSISGWEGLCTSFTQEGIPGTTDRCISSTNSMNPAWGSINRSETARKTSE